MRKKVLRERGMNGEKWKDGRRKGERKEGEKA